MEAIEDQNGYIMKRTSEYGATIKFCEWFCSIKEGKNLENEFYPNGVQCLLLVQVATDFLCFTFTFPFTRG
jgi:hypothetical protein